MHIAFLTEFDPDSFDLRHCPAAKLGHWGRCIAQADALEQAGHRVSRVGGLDRTCEYESFRAKLKRRAYQLLNRSYLAWAEPRFNRDYAQQFAHKLDQLVHSLNGAALDAIVAPDLNLIAHLDTSIPLFFWADTTYANLIDFYPEFSQLCEESRQDLNQLDRLGLARCQGILLASRWAIEGTCATYAIASGKVAEVPLGANFTPPDAFDIENAISKRSHHRCHLVWIGTDWKRKGGAQAMQLAMQLNQNGIPTHLTVIGITFAQIYPWHQQPLPEFVQVLGLLDPQQPEQRRRLEMLFSHAHALLLPSQAECFGHVLCEANAFGLPAIATDSGGIPSVIRSGVNGYTYTQEQWVSASLDRLQTLWHDRATYEALARSSRQEYQTRLSWSQAGRVASQAISERLAHRLN